MQTQISDEELAARGLEFYNAHLKPLLEPVRNGDQVAVHVPDGDYEVAPTSAEADAKLRERHPDAVFVLFEVGKPVMEWPWLDRHAPLRKP